MKYKIQAEISLPFLEKNIDVLLPINKSVFYVCEMLKKIIIEDYDNNFKCNSYFLINQRTGQIYDKKLILKNTDIRNGTKLVFYYQ